VQATALITQEDPSARVIILTMYRQDRHVFAAIRAGAQGYLLKDIDEQDLFRAIRAVHRGEALVDSALAARLLEEFRRLSQRAAQAADVEALTPGEVEVLRRVAEGADNQSIAAQLGLSARTVANRLSSIYRKLHVNCRTEAALFALRHGWASLDSEA
jgi:DNA-binding NarL/FixJ family response regulator